MACVEFAALRHGMRVSTILTERSPSGERGKPSDVQETVLEVEEESEKRGGGRVGCVCVF